MKNIKIFIPLLAGLLLAACADDTKLMVSANPTAPVLNVPSHVSKLYDSTSGAYILSKDSAASIIETFIADSANFGVYTTVTYTLQIDKAGSNFANAQDITSSTKPKLAVTVAQLNKPIASETLLNSTPGTIANFEIRIKAQIGTNYTPIYSNVLAIKVNPYPTYGLLYVPGDYQSTYTGGSWTPSNTNTILYSSANNEKYSGYLDMTNGGSTANFKLTEYPDWNHTNYGLGSTATTLSSTGGNISLPSGYYKIDVDISALTFTTTKIEKWGIIGDFNSWSTGTEVPLTFNSTTKLWSVTTALTAGGIKINANNAWDIAFGIDSSGNYTTSGGNITISSDGTYTITLDLRQYSKPGYNITVVKN